MRTITAALALLAHDSGLRPLRLLGKELVPVVQGGMGVGVSAHRLAGSVARQGAVGTLSSVDLRRHHDDLMARTHKSGDKALIDAANIEALDREAALRGRRRRDRGSIAAPPRRSR